MNETIKDLICELLSRPLRQKALREMNFPEKSNQVAAHDPAGRRLSRYLGRLLRADVGHDDIKIIAKKIQEEESGHKNNEDR